MTICVDFCSANLHDGSASVLARLQREFPQVRVREFGCLGRCEECAAGLYCLVNGIWVGGRTPDELWQNVLAELRRCLEQQT